MGRVKLRNCLVTFLVVGAVASISGCGGAERVSPAELRGTDRDGNGIRDDVDAYIDTFPDSMRANLVAVALNEQASLLVDPASTGAVDTARALAEEANRLITCVPPHLTANALRNAQTSVRARITDNDERRSASAAFEELLRGQVFTAPDCNADTAARSPGR